MKQETILTASDPEETEVKIIFEIIPGESFYKPAIDIISMVPEGLIELEEAQEDLEAMLEDGEFNEDYSDFWEDLELHEYLDEKGDTQ